MTGEHKISAEPKTSGENKITDEVRLYKLSAAENFFDQLRGAVRFEDTGKGRQGTVIVKTDETGGVPVVRTTTGYGAAAQIFRPIHELLARQIQETAALPVAFNNALVEKYTDAYTKMGAHSDQALDLADDSFIALFSCYKNPEAANPPRKLLFETKESGGDKFEISLIPNSVVVFSVAVNRRLRHKIVLEKPSRPTDNEWLGVTLRTSKTFLEFRDRQAYFADGTPLTLAGDEQRREFYRLRRAENDEIDFKYPPISYTVSASDLLPAE